METKICNKCNLEKNIKDFHKDSSKPDNLRSTCKICTNKTVIKYNELNKENIKEKKHINYINNREKISNEMKNYYQDNKEVIKNNSKSYYSANKININKVTVNKRKIRYQTDRFFALKENIRTNLTKLFRVTRTNKTNKTIDIIGCSFEELKQHIESLWEPWMSWDNYGLYNGQLNHGWDLDHKIPIASAKTEADIIKLNHFSNFQPLCSYTNRHIKRDN